MNASVRTRLMESKISEQDSEQKDSKKIGWGNLPYPVIRTIAKVDLQIPTFRI